MDPMDIQANSNPEQDEIQKKTQSLLQSLGLHPAQIAAQNHLGGLMGGINASKSLPGGPGGGMATPPPPKQAPLIAPMTGISKPPEEHIQTTGAAPVETAAPTEEASNATATTAPATPKYQVPAPYHAPPAILQNADNETLHAQQEHDRLVQTGSGIHQIHNPFLRALAHVGEGIETALVPGVAALTPGTEIHHDVLMHGAQEHIDKGLANSKAAVATQTNAQSGAHDEAGADYEIEEANELHGVDAAKNDANTAKAEKARADALKLQNPAAKTEFQAWEQQHPGGQVEDWLTLKAGERGGEFEKAFKEGVASGQFKDTWGDRLKAMHQFAASKQAPQRFPLMFVQTPAGTQAIQPHPGTILPESGAQTAAGINAVNTPTSTERTMSGMAATVVPQAKRVQTDIDSLATSLGPAVGRWNQLLVNKGGTDFPEFAKLDTNLDLLASAIVRTHFGGRGGQEYRKELRHNFGEAQTPEDLKARIDGAIQWLDAYANAHPRNQGSTSQPAPGGNQPKPTASRQQVIDIGKKHGMNEADAVADFQKHGGIIK